MMVTYRLAGVDGEATEEVVDSLTDSDSAYAADQDPEVKFAIARNIAEVRHEWHVEPSLGLENPHSARTVAMKCQRGGFSRCFQKVHLFQTNAAVVPNLVPCVW